MSCYFRHLKEIFEGVGVEVTQENKKDIDRMVHRLVGVDYKSCPPTWKTVKEQIRGDDTVRRQFVERFEGELKGTK